MVRIEINAKDATRHLAEAAVLAGNAGPAFRVISTRLRQDTLRQFSQGGAYWPGPAWKPTHRGGKTLVDRAILRNSIHAASGADWAAAGTDVKYAAIHQFGGVIRAKNAKALRFKIGGQWIMRKSVTIPARPFLPISAAGEFHPDTERFITDRLWNHINRQNV